MQSLEEILKLNAKASGISVADNEQIAVGNRFITSPNARPKIHIGPTQTHVRNDDIPSSYFQFVVALSE